MSVCMNVSMYVCMYIYTYIFNTLIHLPYGSGHHETLGDIKLSIPIFSRSQFGAP